MASPFHGKWEFFETENVEAYGKFIVAPAGLQHAFSHVKVVEEINVVDHQVDFNISVPAIEIPAAEFEHIFEFDQVCEHPLPFGGVASGSVQREGPARWVGKFTTPHVAELVLIREHVNNEMLTIIEIGDSRYIRRFARAFDELSTIEAVLEGEPLHGLWIRTNSENLHSFLEKLGIPEALRHLLEAQQIRERIEVDGGKVKVKIITDKQTIPSSVHQVHGRFGEEFTLILPFGHIAKGVLERESEHKWVAKMVGPHNHEFKVIREVLGDEMRVIFETAIGTSIRKFRRI